MAYESSLNYAVWATSWSIPPQGLSSFPALVPLLRPVDAIANTSRPYDDLSGLSNEAWDAYAALVVQIPRGRRVYLGHYFQDDGICTFNQKVNYYKTTRDGTTYGNSPNENISGFGDANPLKYVSIWGLTGAEDGKTSVKAFLQKCVSFGLTFDYYWDDTESSYEYRLGSVYNTYTGAFDVNGIPTGYPSFLTAPDPRRTPAVVNDFRFASRNALYININGRSFSEEFLQKYKDITNNQAESRTSQEILSFFTNVTTRQDFKYPWGTANIYAMYAWSSALYTYYFGNIRKKVLFEPISELNLPVKVFQTDLYPLTKDEAKYTSDLNSHYFIQDNISGYLTCMHNYGDLSPSIAQSYGYTPNPITDDEKFKLVYGGSSIGTPAYQAFVKEIRKLRGMLRSNASAYQNFISVVSSPFYAGEDRQLYQDPRYWYEMMYHICLHGVSFFNAFIKQGESTGFAEIQQVLDEWKTISQNNRAVPCSNAQGSTSVLVDRINLSDAASFGIISGGYVASAGKYIWRLTAASGVNNYTLNDTSQVDIPLNIEIPANSRGVWIIRTVPGIPSYKAGTTNTDTIVVTVGNKPVQKPEIITTSPLSRSPYNSRISIGERLSPNAPVFGIERPPVTQSANADYRVPNNHRNRIFIQMDLSSHSNSVGWDGWNTVTVATYQGNRYANESTVTGWDGEPVTRAYPFEFDPVNPEVSSPWHNILYENCYPFYKWGARSYLLWMPFGALANGFALTSEVWKRTFTSTTDKKRCPARWKGFTQAVKALLEGTMSPAGKPAMSEPANICIYFPVNSGDNPYVNKRNTLWQSLGATDFERDEMYYRYVDDFIASVISMKSQSPTAGKLYVMFDTMSMSATPNTVHTFRTRPTYKTDALELSDWYMFNKLVENGIPVFYEARTTKTITDTNGTYVKEWANLPATCGEYWYLFSDPRYNTCCNYATSQDTKVIFRQHDSNYPPISPFESTEVYQSRKTTTFNGKTKTLVYTTTAYNYYSPHNYCFNLFALSDNYRYYYNKTSDQQLKGVKSDVENFIAINPRMFMGGKILLETNVGPSVNNLENYWRLATYIHLPVSYLNETVWNNTADVQNNYTGGLWNTAGKTYWDNNVRQSSFDNMITFLHNFSSNYAAPSDDWTGITYGFDPVSLGTIHYV